MERKRVLIAINHPNEIEKFKELLISYGYEVKIVDNGISALNLSSEFRPHIILCELYLTKVDGHHLLKEIKSQSSTRLIPFILMSRHRSVNERVHSINLGVDDYITLPFDPHEVIARLDVILKEVENYETTPKRNAKGFSGKLQEMNVVELIQTFEIAKKSGIINVQGDTDEGSIYIKNGEVVKVDLDNLPTLQALFRMFTFNTGAFQVEIKEVDQAGKLAAPTSELVKKGLSYRDRWERLCKSLPPLNTKVRIVKKDVTNAFTNDEKTLLNNITGKTSIIALIKTSKLDDLSVLNLILSFFKRGLIEEVSLEENELDDNKMETNGANGKNTNPKFSNAILGFLNAHKENLVRRKLHRNGNSDAEHSLRLNKKTSDIDNNQGHLKKSELLMIREKLSKNKKDDLISIN